MKRYQAFLVFCCLMVVMFIVIVYVNDIPIDRTEPPFSENISCFWRKSSGILELGQEKWDDAMLVPDGCIFFHESYCSDPMLTPRQACAVESAARNNPRMNVFLLYLSPEKMSEKSLELKSVLESYGNVYVRRIRLASFVKDTPLEDWYLKRMSDFVEDEDWLASRISDYVRLLTLWKFGGISLNLDSVVQSRLDNFSNFIGVTDTRNADVGVLGFEISSNFGRKLANTCINLVKDTQVDYNWNHNLTFILTKAIHLLCFRNKSLPGYCQSVRVYKPDTFYPVPENSWQSYFNRNSTEELLSTINEAKIIHVWSEYSKDTIMFTNSSSPYNIAAMKHCPKIHQHCHPTF